MEGALTWYITTFGCGLLFFGLGIYAQRLEKPMWFWSGTKVDPSEITDIEQYNQENGVMWKLYSLWFFAAGLAYIWSEIAGIVLLVMSFLPGFPLLILHYTKIYNKYKAPGAAGGKPWK